MGDFISQVGAVTLLVADAERPRERPGQRVRLAPGIRGFGRGSSGVGLAV